MSKCKSPAALLNDTITVGRMIELLQRFDENAPLVVSSDYGDYCNTEQVHNVGDDDIVNGLESDMEKSGYSRSGVSFDSDQSPCLDYHPEFGYAMNDDDQDVVVIRL